MNFSLFFLKNFIVKSVDICGDSNLHSKEEIETYNEETNKNEAKFYNINGTQ